MTVAELIEKLKGMPQGMKVITSALGHEPNPEQVWDDEAENYKVIL